ncbi:hypothetical protein CPB83DRAFT_431732 [Crepidotus variabilis]|uniref:Uncharacterized protein n=1 Tax=Crepidotus variabilis TaxID=179855 RepID=A0A9P6EDU2_9AGAR|nr:hypothetical protein CPB83DRAFT_431732 [Crepidotus variabilis]
MDKSNWGDYEEETFVDEDKTSFQGVPPWITGEGIFQQSFRQRLLDVGQDVEQEWPELRDDEKLHLFRTLKTGLRMSHASDLKVLEELLGIYTTCLKYMHQYPHKRDPEHRECMRSVLKSDLRPILLSLWHNQFKLVFPFEQQPLDDSLLLATSKFISAIFSLYHQNRTFEYAAPGLTDLCVNSPLIAIVAHVLFFAGSDETRRLAYTGLETALDIDATTGAQKGSKPYFRKLRKSHIRQQIQIILHDDKIADDGLLYVLNQYGYIAEADLPEDLRDVALSKSFALLERQCSGKSAITLDHDTKLLAMEVPNIIVRANIKTSTSPIVALQEVIAKFDAFKLMASAAMFFAQNFDWLQWSLKWNKHTLPKLQASFVQQNVRQTDRKRKFSLQYEGFRVMMKVSQPVTCGCSSCQ